MGRLADADPVAVALPWLNRADSYTSQEIGASGRVSAYNEPPYPCVRLTDPPGNDRDLVHLIAPLLQIEVLGDMDGTPGKPKLRRILYAALEDLTALPNQVAGASDAVVTYVASTGGGGWSPYPNGQPRYLATVQLYMHPPQAS